MKSSGSLLALRMGSVYLRARWFWGVGLVLVPLVLWLFNGELGDVWLVGVAGLVTLAHATGMKVLDVDSVVSAVLVDVLATHLAVMLLGSDSSHTGVVLAGVGFTLLIMLFTHGPERVWVGVVNAVLTTAGVGATTDWQVHDMIGPLLGAGGLSTLIVFVIAAFQARVAELEMSRAVTLGIASHELKNRLAGIIGVTQLLAEEELDGAETGELLGMAHREAVAAGSVVEDLLSASRSERGVVQTIVERVDLAEMVRQTVDTFEYHGKDVVVEGASGPVWVTADPLRTPQVLRNLLSNADRYGGPDVRVVIEPRGDVVSVLVSDDGPGVDADDVPDLFTPYHRSKSGQALPGSTGLGLWISRNLMQSMGGDLAYRRLQDRTVFEATFRPAPEAAQS